MTAGIDTHNHIQNVEGKIEGVVFDGDWHKHPLEFLEILKTVQKMGWTTLIETDLTYSEFKLRIGIAAYNKNMGTSVRRSTTPPHDVEMLTIMGGVLIDYYLSHVQYWTYAKGVLDRIDLPKEGDGSC